MDLGLSGKQREKEVVRKASHSVMTDFKEEKKRSRRSPTALGQTASKDRETRISGLETKRSGSFSQ